MSGKHSSSADPSRPRQTPHATEGHDDGDVLDHVSDGPQDSESVESAAPVEPEGADAMRDEVAHLHTAMRSQRDIGMAIGLLSARYGCSTEEAWRTMLRVSQDTNTKVRHMAHALVRTHDGTADDEDRGLLASFVAQLPPSGWPQGSPKGNDPAP